MITNNHRNHNNNINPLTHEKLLPILIAHFGVPPDPKGDVHVDCPFCSKPAKRNQTHFRFSKKGYCCHVCGEKGGLRKLYKRLGLDGTTPPTPTKQPLPARTQKSKSTTPPKWKTDQVEAELLLQQYESHPKRYELWQAYKGLSKETIDEYRLGVGYLPNDRKNLRLIVPVIVNGQLVGLRGRLVGESKNDALKWLNATESGAHLFNAEKICSERALFIQENNVDTIWNMQEILEVAAVAPTTGAGTWREEWTKLIKDIMPPLVIVAYDNDLAGLPNAETKAKSESLYHEKNLQIPEAAGVKLIKQLQAAGIPAIGWEWPTGTPEKADIGWLLEQADGVETIQRFLRDVGRKVRSVKQPYLSDAKDLMTNLPKAVVVRSPIGSGKTQMIEELIRQMGGETSVLYITHRNALNLNTANRFSDLGFVSDKSLPFGEECRREKRLVMTINSLLKLGVERIPKYDLVIIDESDQVADHLVGDTFVGNHSANVYRFLQHIWRRAKHVICLDAHLSNLTFEFLSPVFPRNEILLIQNLYRLGKRPVILCQNENMCLARARESLEKGKRIIIFTDSKEKAKQYDRLFRDISWGIKMITVHSENQYDKDAASLLANTNQGTCNYQLVISSPIISSGVDIQDKFDEVYSLNTGSTLTPEDIIQQIGRVRELTVEGVIIVKHPNIILENETDPTEIKRFDLDAYRAQYDLLEWDDEGRLLSELPPTLESHLHLYANAKAKRNRLMNNPLQLLKALLEEEGYMRIIESIDCSEHGAEDYKYRNDDTMFEYISANMPEIKRELTNQDINNIIDSKPISKSEYLEHIRNKTASTEIVWGYRRWELQEKYGQTQITRQLIEEDEKLGDAIYAFVDLLRPNQHLRIEERAENDVPIEKRRYPARRQECLVTFLTSTFGENFFSSDAELSNEDFPADLVKVFTARQGHRLLGLRSDRHNNSKTLICAILKTLGLGLDSYQRSHEGERIRFYSIDKNRLKRMLELALQRAEYHRIQLDTNEVNKIKQFLFKPTKSSGSQQVKTVTP